jgi:hypothetical protein
VLKAVRRLARKHGYTVAVLPKRGKGSHTIWGVFASDGTEVGRFGLTGHHGPMSHTVTDNAEEALVDLFGEGWL